MAADVSSGGRLPPDFNYGVTKDGRVFFIDEGHKDTTWLHPLNGRPVQTGYFTDQSLPDGWEQAVTLEGTLYYIDHNTRSTSFQHPVTGRAHRYGDNPPQSLPQNVSQQKAQSPSSPHSPTSPHEKSFKRNQAKQRSLKAPSAKRNPNSRVVRKAWLYRWETGGLTKSWKKRWCVLVDFALFIYKDEQEENAVASVLLPSYRINSVLPTEPVFRHYAFKLEHENTKTLYFATDSTQDLENWLSLLRQEAMMKGQKGFTREKNNNKPLKLIPKSPIISRNNDAEDDEPLFPSSLNWQDQGSYRRLQRDEDIEPPDLEQSASYPQHQDNVPSHLRVPSQYDGSPANNNNRTVDYPSSKNSQMSPRDSYTTGNSRNSRDDAINPERQSVDPRDSRYKPGNEPGDPSVGSMSYYQPSHPTNGVNSPNDYPSQQSPQFRNYDPRDSNFQDAPPHNEGYRQDNRNQPAMEGPKGFQGRQKRINPSYFGGDENAGGEPHNVYPKDAGLDQTNNYDSGMQPDMGYGSAPWGEAQDRTLSPADAKYPDDGYRGQNPNIADGPRGDRSSKASDRPVFDDYNRYIPSGNLPSDQTDNRPSRISDRPPFDSYQGDRSSRASDHPPYEGYHGDRSSKASDRPPYEGYQGDRSSRASDRPPYDGYQGDISSKASDRPPYEGYQGDRSSKASNRPPHDGYQGDRSSKASDRPPYDGYHGDRSSKASDRPPYNGYQGDRSSKASGHPPYDGYHGNRSSKASDHPPNDDYHGDRSSKASNHPPYDGYHGDRSSKASDRPPYDGYHGDRSSKASDHPAFDDYNRYIPSSHLPNQHGDQPSRISDNPPFDGYHGDRSSKASDRPPFDGYHGDRSSKASDRPPFDGYHDDWPARAPEHPQFDSYHGDRSSRASNNPQLDGYNGDRSSMTLDNRPYDGHGNRPTQGPPSYKNNDIPDYRDQAQPSLPISQPNSQAVHRHPHPELTVSIPHTYVNLPSDTDSADRNSSSRQQEVSPGRPPYPSSVRQQMAEEIAMTKTPHTSNDYVTSVENEKRRMQQKEYFQYPTPLLEPDQGYPQGSPHGQTSRNSTLVRDQTDGFFNNSSPGNMGKAYQGNQSHEAMGRVPQPNPLHESFSRDHQEQSHRHPNRPDSHDRSRESLSRDLQYGQSRNSINQNALGESQDMEREMHNKSRDSFSRDPRFNQSRDSIGRDSYHETSQDNLGRHPRRDHSHDSIERDPRFDQSFNSQGKPSHYQSMGSMDRGGGGQPSFLARPLTDTTIKSQSMGNLGRSPQERSPEGRSPQGRSPQEGSPQSTSLQGRSPHDRSPQGSVPSSRSRERDSMGRSPRRIVNRDADGNTSPKEEAQELRDAYKSIQELQQKQKEDDYSVQKPQNLAPLYRTQASLSVENLTNTANGEMFYSPAGSYVPDLEKPDRVVERGSAFRPPSSCTSSIRDSSVVGYNLGSYPETRPDDPPSNYGSRLDKENPEHPFFELEDIVGSYVEVDQSYGRSGTGQFKGHKKKKPELLIHTVKEEPDMLDTDVLETRHLQGKNKKYPLNGNRLRMSISAGDLIGKTHDELVLLLIQLRRNQASLDKARDYYRECLSRRRSSEREYRRQRNDSTGRLEDSLEDDHQSFLDFKRELEEIENKQEVYKPLINLVDNMVTMGSLYGGDNFMLATQYRKHLLRPDQFTEPKMMLEFSRENQEKRFVKEIEDEIKQLSADEVDLEEKLERLYDLDRKLQEQSFKVTSFREDKELLEKALTGILHQQDQFRNNPREMNRLMHQQRTIEKELSLVMQQLAEASQELEETTAENNKIEHEVTLLRTKVNGELTRSRSAPSLAGESARTKMMMEKELAKVQNMMAGLSNEGARLKEAMTTLRRSSSGTQLAALLEKESETATTKKKPSSYMITDIDTNETIDASKSSADATFVSSPRSSEDYRTSSLPIREDNVSSVQTSYMTSAPESQNTSNQQAIPSSAQYSVNPDYSADSEQMNSRLADEGDSTGMNRPIISHQRQDSIATGSDDSDNSMIVDPDAPDVTWDISDAEDNTKRFFGILPKEKAKVLTVRDVKRQHDQRKEREKMRREVDDDDLGGCYAVSGNHQIPVEDQSQDRSGPNWYSPVNSGITSNMNSDPSPLYENLPRARSVPALAADNSAANSRRSSITLLAPKPFTRYEDRQTTIVKAKPFMARPFNSDLQLNVDTQSRFAPVSFNPSAHRVTQSFGAQPFYSEMNLNTNTDFVDDHHQPPVERDYTSTELPPVGSTEMESFNSPASSQYPWHSSVAQQEMSIYNVKKSPKGRYLTISSTEPVKLETKSWPQSSLHSVAGDLMTNKPIDNVPDIVKSSTKKSEMELYDEFMIDRELYRPGPVDIPERYMPDSDEEISEEEKVKRCEKAEKIKKLLTQQSIHSLSQPDISQIDKRDKQVLHQKVEMEKYRRSHLLGLGQELARQVTLKSKEAAARRRKTWSGDQFSEALKSHSDGQHLQDDLSLGRQDMFV